MPDKAKKGNVQRKAAPPGKNPPKPEALPEEEKSEERQTLEKLEGEFDTGIYELIRSDTDE